MTAAQVWLWGSLIGAVSLRSPEDTAEFEYDKSFLDSGIELSPLMMPLQKNIYRFPELSHQSFHGLPGMLADSLPDKFGNAMIDAWLASQGRSAESFDAVERLCYTGTRGMGALEYVPATGPDADRHDQINVEALVKLASQILQERSNIRLNADDHAMQQMIRIGTSAGGARAKAVIAMNEETGEIRSGQIDAGEGFSYWLMKFDGVNNNRDKEAEDAPCYTRIEYAYHKMALAAGIEMTECRLYEENGWSHFLTRRFDRDPESGKKLHLQSLGGIAHFDFNLPGAYSYEQAAFVMRRLGLKQDSTDQLFRRMVFNIASRNQDDHVKNISFLMDKNGAWKLSPAYDITYAYNPGGLWTGSHQMSINGKRDNITFEDLLASSKKMNISGQKARKIIDEVCSAIRKWNTFAENAGLSEELMSKIARAHIAIL